MTASDDKTSINSRTSVERADDRQTKTALSSSDSSPIEQTYDRSDDATEKELGQTPPGSGGDDSPEKEEEQEDYRLDRTPSQAQKLGKKKIAVVMGALCVCRFLFSCSISMFRITFNSSELSRGANYGSRG